MWPFISKPKSPAYEIRQQGEKVYVNWFLPIEEWSPETWDTYLIDLQTTVRNSVSKAEYEIISSGNMQADPNAFVYAQSVMPLVIKEFDLNEVEDQVGIANYQMGLLIIDFCAADGVEYPRYFKGIQLKPFLTHSDDK